MMCHAMVGMRLGHTGCPISPHTIPSSSNPAQVGHGHPFSSSIFLTQILTHRHQYTNVSLVWELSIVSRLLSKLNLYVHQIYGVFDLAIDFGNFCHFSIDPVNLARITIKQRIKCGLSVQYWTKSLTLKITDFDSVKFSQYKNKISKAFCI